MATTTPDQWNKRYAAGDTPWDGNDPSDELAKVVGEFEIAPCRMLELGCGTGTNAVWLAQQGFDVTAVDASEIAIDKAKDRAAKAGVDVHFLAGDLLDLPDLGEPFVFTFDRGVYHAVRRHDAAGFIRVVTAQTAPDGWYLTLAGNANDPRGSEPGPPKVTAEEMCQELSRAFELYQLRRFQFADEGVTDQAKLHLAWSALWRRRSYPEA